MHFTGPLSPIETQKAKAAKTSLGHPFFAYGLIGLLTIILLIESRLRLGVGPDPLSIDPLTLFGLGGTQGVAVLHDGEIWRLFTAPLLHGGILHLLGNAVALWFAARLCEPMIGWRWFAAIFAVSAVSGAILSVLLMPSLTVGVGASGGIVGLAAATAIFAIRSPPHIRIAMAIGGLRIAIPSLLPIFTNAKAAGGVTIDVAAHAGGAAAGALVAIILLAIWRADAPRPPFGRLALALVVLFFGVAAASLYPIIGSYDKAKDIAALDPTFPTDFKFAVAHAKELVQRYPRDPRVRAASAEAFVAGGDVAKAKAELLIALHDKRMLRVDVKENLEIYLRTRLAQLLFEQREKTEAAATVAPVCGTAAGEFKKAIDEMRLCPPPSGAAKKS